METSELLNLAVQTAREQFSRDDRETIGELAGAVNELQEDRRLTIRLLNREVQDVHELREQVGRYQAEIAELRDELHELATTVRRGQDNRLSEAAERICSTCGYEGWHFYSCEASHDSAPTTTETRR